MIIRSYFFGICSPNPDGHASYTCLVDIPKETQQLIGLPRIMSVKSNVDGSFNGQTLSWRTYIGYGKGMTNNRSTYEALFSLLLKLNDLGLRVHPNRIYTDSLMVANQTKGIFKVGRGTYVDMYENTMALLRTFPRADVIWLPKERNMARQLSNQLWLKEQQ